MASLGMCSSGGHLTKLGSVGSGQRGCHLRPRSTSTLGIQKPPCFWASCMRRSIYPSGSWPLSLLPFPSPLGIQLLQGIPATGPRMPSVGHLISSPKWTQGGWLQPSRFNLVSIFPGHLTLLLARNFSPERKVAQTITGELEEALAQVFPAPPKRPWAAFSRGHATLDWKTGAPLGMLNGALLAGHHRGPL